MTLPAAPSDSGRKFSVTELPCVYTRPNSSITMMDRFTSGLYQYKETVPQNMNTDYKGRVHTDQ